MPYAYSVLLTSSTYFCMHKTTRSMMCIVHVVYPEHVVRARMQNMDYAHKKILCILRNIHSTIRALNILRESMHTVTVHTPAVRSSLLMTASARDRIHDRGVRIITS